MEPEISVLNFYERELLTTVALPFLRDFYNKTPYGFLKNIMISKVENINSAEFISQLDVAGIKFGLSIRCYQKFTPLIIQRFREAAGFLWNLHPGILPYYRGVMTLFRSMLNKDQYFGYTLHEVNSRWDAGAILAVRKQEIDYKKCFLSNMISSWRLGHAIALDTVLFFFRNEDMNPAQQEEAYASYYSFPDISELKAFSGKGLKLVDRCTVIKQYVDNFIGTNEALRDLLTQRLEERKCRYLA